MNGHRLETVCPHCKTVNRAHEGRNPDAMPKDGDVAMCWHCKGLSVYTMGPFGMLARTPSDAELARLVENPTIARIIRTAQTAQTLAEAKQAIREADPDD